MNRMGGDLAIESEMVWYDNGNGLGLGSRQADRDAMD